MTQELQALLERINQDGVEKAEAERQRIVDDAKAEAEKTVENARREAEKIVGQARDEAELLIRKGEESLRQAGRDLLLSLREQLQARLAAVVKACVNADSDPKSFAEAIAKAVGRQLGEESVSDLEVMVPEKDRDAMEKHILAALDKDLRKNVTITPLPELESGFRLRFDKDDVLYDFSDTALADSLMLFLGSRLAEILASAENGDGSGSTSK